MAKTKKKRRGWKDLDATEKLGYVWVMFYAILIIATASAILVPAYKKWQWESEGKKSGRVLEAPAGAPSAVCLKDMANGLVRVDSGAFQAFGISRKSLEG